MFDFEEIKTMLTSDSMPLELKGVVKRLFEGHKKFGSYSINEKKISPSYFVEVFTGRQRNFVNKDITHYGLAESLKIIRALDKSKSIVMAKFSDTNWHCRVILTSDDGELYRVVGCFFWSRT